MPRFHFYFTAWNFIGKQISKLNNHSKILFLHICPQNFSFSLSSILDFTLTTNEPYNILGRNNLNGSSTSVVQQWRNSKIEKNCSTTWRSKVVLTVWSMNLVGSYACMGFLISTACLRPYGDDHGSYQSKW